MWVAKRNTPKNRWLNKEKSLKLLKNIVGKITVRVPEFHTILLFQARGFEAFGTSGNESATGFTTAVFQSKGRDETGLLPAAYSTTGAFIFSSAFAAY